MPSSMTVLQLCICTGGGELLLGHRTLTWELARTPGWPVAVGRGCI